jgi:4-hydroxyphenylpyruvate dioxygenase-like putative hemolysin
MAKLICPKCKKVFDLDTDGACPVCKRQQPGVYDFANSDEFLKKNVALVMEERKKARLEGLVGGLECVIINTEADRHRAAAEELLRYTGLDFAGAFEDAAYATCVLKTPGSADFLVRSRHAQDNPFTPFNVFPKSKHLPNTRIEAFVFAANDIEKYVAIQKSRGVRFLTDSVARTDKYLFIQTQPSRFTGNSLGFIQWKGKRGDYATRDSRGLDWNLKKPAMPHLKNIRHLDHAATRVKAEDRDAAIIEFLDLTNYYFDFAIYVNVFNSITNVARLTKEGYAMVFTSGISPYISDELSGPTEKFVHNYGQRVHHMAFHTENIEETFGALGNDGMKFLITLVGSPDEGLGQTFTVASPNTLLVNEYIHRYGGFDGFFTKSNVTALTGATGKQ